MHHEQDEDRFFLPDDVERGYAWWFARELPRDGAVILVAAEGEAIVGYAYGTLEERDWNMLLDAHGAIHDVYVDESARRAGTGKKLVEAIVEALEKKGAARIVLSTMVQNERAQRVFRACGFRPTMLEMTRSHR
jgi:ribosomal protein S18 acetylase RimI-like enzyme